MAMCGGASAPRNPSEDEIAIISEVREDFANQSNEKVETFEVIQLKSQVVAGTNYFAKVRYGEGKFAHLRVFKPLPCNEGEKVKLHSYQLQKKHEDAIEYF